MVSSICKATRPSMCPPPLWTHHLPRTVWQLDLNGLAIPSCIRMADFTSRPSETVKCAQCCQPLMELDHKAKGLRIASCWCAAFPSLLLFVQEWGTVLMCCCKERKLQEV